MEFRYPGIASAAMFLTFGTLGSLLWAYRNGVVRVTDTFKQGLQMVTGGYLITLLMFWLMSMLGGAAGMRALPSLFSAGEQQGAGGGVRARVHAHAHTHAHAQIMHKSCPCCIGCCHGVCTCQLRRVVHNGWE
jgi:hypothetical protein